MLKQQGYATACVGKWHLGMDWVKNPGKQVTPLNIEPASQVWNVDYTKPIANGPNSVGFDYYYGISASLDMVPYTFIENDRVTIVPTLEKEWPMMPGRERGRCRKGPAAPGVRGGTRAADADPKGRRLHRRPWPGREGRQAVLPLSAAQRARTRPSRPRRHGKARAG